MSETSEKIKTLKAGWNTWPAPVVARSEIGKFTGGLLGSRTMANLDSQRRGPEGRLRMGRKVAYLKSSLVEWLIGRLEV